MYRIYSLLFTIGFLIVAPSYLWRKRASGALAGWRERFGRLPNSFRQQQPGAIWIHAVSVGETLAISRLVSELQERYPDRRIFLSHATATGRAAGEKRLPQIAGRFYLPFDWHWSVRRVFELIRPSLLLIVETELWPNLLRTARDFECQTVLVNARISDKSLSGYRMARLLMRHVFENVSRICAQSAEDADRFRQIGAPADRVVVTGNLKFDGKPPVLSEFWIGLNKALGSRHPIFIAGSTMPGEEPLVLEAWKQIRDRFPEVLMIMAPRHPERFEAVAQILRERSHNFVRRSAIPKNVAGTAQIGAAGILLLDSIGELAGVFALADIVFVGGTLVPSGGHNPLEPAYWAKPVIFGPHMQNFREMAKRFLEAGAAIEVADSRGLARAVIDLAENPGHAAEIGERARAVSEEQSGATLRVLHELERWLGAEQEKQGRQVRQWA